MTENYIYYNNFICYYIYIFYKSIGGYTNEKIIVIYDDSYNYY